MKHTCIRVNRLMDFTERMSPLGNATADECADYCLTLFSDLTRKVTMQNLFNDGGFSSMGMSARAMEMYNKSLDCRDCHDHPDFCNTETDDSTAGK